MTHETIPQTVLVPGSGVDTIEKLPRFRRRAGRARGAAVGGARPVGAAPAGAARRGDGRPGRRRRALDAGCRRRDVGGRLPRVAADDVGPAAGPPGDAGATATGPRRPPAGPGGGAGPSATMPSSVQARPGQE